MSDDAALATWLRQQPDDSLVALLRARPDLASPPPGSLAALAGRALSRQSVRAATDNLDFLTLTVLDALLVARADITGAPVSDVLALVDGRATELQVRATLDRLRGLALAWGEGTVHVAAETRLGLPWVVGQVISEETPDSYDAARAELAVTDERGMELLRALIAGSPIGRTRDAAPDAPPDRPVQRLLAAGLLQRIDDETVLLPRFVAQLLRDEEPDRLQPPVPETTAATQAAADAAAAGAALDLVREVGLLLDELGVNPAPQLRSGGLGVREVKRLTKATGIDDSRMGLLLEVLAAAELIAVGDPDVETDADGWHWAPTVQTDRYTELPTAVRWFRLVSAWLLLAARPDLIGKRTSEDKPIAALSDSLRSTAAPYDRKLLLEILGELDPGHGLTAPAMSRVMRWRRPRWGARLGAEPVAALLFEATTLGVIGRGALTTHIRTFLDSAGDETATLAAMEKALPAPIDHFLVQADLTVVAPGPPTRELELDLMAVANLESAGAASVFRVSEASIRRALDSGRTATGLHSFFGSRSKTPVPQSLTYLIDDVARRHGQLRAGLATSFLRCDDVALLTQVMASHLAEDLSLRLLAPTVAVSLAPLAELVAGLRGAGFAPAAEDASGTIVELHARRARVTPQPHRTGWTPPVLSEPAATAVIKALRAAGDRSDGVRIEPSLAVALLQQSAKAQTSVLIGYVDPAGVASSRVVNPISVRGGQLSAFDTAAGRIRDFAIHRITAVSPPG
ncbi:DNA-binding protein [Mycobacterium sp. CBMA271]|uniref:helicase-associated domain-containing protein n=1 Tax=unclassified Mycobacteroides TaxID=2618759 RepID=UPI0012DDA7D0|nr:MULTISPECIES: helicase-associated domain-containing protein [unclassified Mycobacteroides]MUM15889.1 DNA-binding protein [Mycobacteroides sp. CBMA 326]MUM24500.1 DNA-binding protein [Mycobacteroides sp. CBMA 271]